MEKTFGNSTPLLLGDENPSNFAYFSLLQAYYWYQGFS